MKILKDLLIENDNKMLATELDTIGQDIMSQYKSYMATVKMLSEGVLDFESDDLSYLFDEAKKRYQAAKRALGLANKLRDPAQKAENQKRIMGAMNQLRAFNRTLEKSIADEMVALQQSMRPNGDMMGVPTSSAPRFNSRFQDLKAVVPEGPDAV
jgi:hypothetical protein